MGHKNSEKSKLYRESLIEQVDKKLIEMFSDGFGTSKLIATKDDTKRDKIFSGNTYKTYKQNCHHFVRWIMEKYPECTTLRACKKHVKEWLQFRTDSINPHTKRPYQASTIQTEAKSLGKLYGIKPDDPQFFECPKRNREDFTRSRGPAKRDSHFSERNNWDLVCFCKGTGLRRNIVETIKGRDFFTREQLESMLNSKTKPDFNSPDIDTWLKITTDALNNFPDMQYFVLSYNDKGGRSRLSPLCGEYTDKIVDRFRHTNPDDKVWEHVSSAMDVHGYRSEYATWIYKHYARPIKEIPYDRVNKGTGKRFQGDVYSCRGDEKGKKLDRRAMKLASKALGHNRIEVVARFYIRGL